MRNTFIGYTYIVYNVIISYCINYGNESFRY